METNQLIYSLIFNLSLATYVLVVLLFREEMLSSAWPEQK